MKTAKKWPLLFKQTSLGKIQQWGIHVEGNLITTVYGLTDGKKQSTTDILKHGLNIGKSNETTPEQQAELQAEQEYQGKLKRGYVLELAQAAEKKNNLAAVEPMLAFPIEKKEKYAVFPALAQPKLDGCLHGKSKLVTDLGEIAIGEIVDKRLACNVLSYNEQTGESEFRSITNWFNNGSAPYAEWMYVKLSKSQIVKCTPNHKFFTNRGWVRADALDPKIHAILADRGSDRLFGLLTGTLLGDSSLTFEKRLPGSFSYRITYRHTNKELFDFKIATLNIGSHVNEITTGFGSAGFQHHSRALTYSDYPVARMYHTGNNAESKGRRKLVGYKFLLKVMSDEALSLWIADDGSLAMNNGNRLTPLLNLHTQGFSAEQVQQLVLFFGKKYGCVPRVNRDKKVESGGGLFLTFGTKDTLYMLNRLRSLHCKGVEYKYYFPTEGYIKPVQSEYAFHSFTVCGSRRNVPQTKYDIEVDGNHNYFANGVLVHNCRMLAIIDNGSAKLWSRTQKPIAGHTHIVDELERLYAGKSVILDGELYSHKFADDFNELMHLAKHGDSTELQYNVYDIVAPGNHNERMKAFVSGEHVLPVKTVVVNSREELDKMQGEFIADGYEGAIYRNASAPYEHKRSNGLLKVKSFTDSEFKIIGAKESVRPGIIGTFTMITKDGNEFGATPKASIAQKRAYWNDRAKYVGLIGTVQYQGFTPPPASVPRFPVFKAVREE